MKKIISFSVLFILLCSFSIVIQNHFTELVSEKLEQYSTTNSPEKIYVHTDKPYYALDETIWFTSYLVDGITHEKSKKSWVIYVELIDEKDSLVSKKKLFTNNIAAAGDFKIEKNWKSGKYLLRAYTNYMRNKSADFFFKKEINIWSADKADSLELSLVKPSGPDLSFQQIKPDLQFFPEGGDLVENLRSKVVIKVKGVGLKDITFSGKILNAQNDIISNFGTSKFGLGVFSISPQPEKTYYAKLEVNGVEYKYPLPKALPQGHTLGVINAGNHIIVNVKSNETMALSNTYLVVHQRGKQILNKFEPEPKDSYTLKIPVDNLKDGVVHLTLFDATGNPVCERLVFIANDNNKGIIEIKKDKGVLGTRKRQTIQITTKDQNGAVLPSHLSMSVRDLNAFPYNRFHKNIKTYLLLNSDLRGDIENPGYFFDEIDSKKRYLLDLTMLTNGWRRFTWKDLLYNKDTNSFDAEKGIYISGRTKRLKKPYGPVSAPTRLTFYGENIIQEPVKKSNISGEFKFGPFIFFDSIQTIVESRLTDFKSEREADRNILILIDQNEEQPKVNHNRVTKNNIASNLQLENYIKVTKYIQQLNFELDQQRQQLEEVTIIAKKKEDYEKREEDMNNQTDYGFPSNRLDLETDFIDYGQTVFDLLATVPGVSVFNDSIYIRGGTGSPLVLLDKFEVDMDFLSSLQASEISFIDVLKGADAALYPNSGNGVIAIYSKTGNTSFSRNIKRKPGIIDFPAKGFYTAKKFYAPDHLSGFEEATKPDIRTTLHWEPKITINNEGGQDISFFTSDSKSDYLIEIEGVSQSGIPLHAVSTFNVD
ncbi:Plug domain-containing protein [Algibacter sp. 2305UL17-15]|uniref:TonB-dependent receptor n=1 Tax=Algibacter sp. 2305UL17-15 TaxID=3231268 RepID=UPI003459CB92